MKKILINESIRIQLREHFRVSDVTIRRALQGDNVTTFLHMRIREKALQIGGVYKE